MRQLPCQSRSDRLSRGTVDQAIESYLTLDFISPSSDKVGAADHRDMARVDQPQDRSGLNDEDMLKSDPPNSQRVNP